MGVMWVGPHVNRCEWAGGGTWGAAPVLAAIRAARLVRLSAAEGIRSKGRGRGRGDGRDEEEEEGRRRVAAALRRPACRACMDVSPLHVRRPPLAPAQGAYGGRKPERLAHRAAVPLAGRARPYQENPSPWPQSRPGGGRGGRRPPACAKTRRKHGPPGLRERGSSVGLAPCQRREGGLQGCAERMPFLPDQAKPPPAGRLAAVRPPRGCVRAARGARGAERAPPALCGAGAAVGGGAAREWGRGAVGLYHGPWN
ncbi:MAG: hypothetical protein J3K34DRAFT_436019 [Monoraphidium minutum]|nr:MAG: hypothetical protein J3K34DRAFT_436019 [Monoraphidium minutum]